MIQLKKVTENNFKACLSLNAGLNNNDFVDSVSYSLSEAWLYYPNIKPFAIYNDEFLIGFVSIYVGDNNYQIINFFIDVSFQNKGYGTDALNYCIDYLKQTFSATRISVPVHINHTNAQKFWQKQGFICSDVIEDNYVFMRKYFI